jgi:hypothetical protein
LFTKLLEPHYELVISNNPDVLIYSCYGFEHLKYRCHKIFYTGENVRPDFKECDFSLSFDYPDYKNRNLRLPLVRWHHVERLFEKKQIEKILGSKTKFCCMVVSNPNCKERNLFFEKLSSYKKVDSGGKFSNNIGYNVDDKVKFLQDYKFVLAFENSCYPGYTTEKIIAPMFKNSLPVYWGNPNIETDFNPRSFINVHNYKSFDEAIEEIIRVDKDDKAYGKYLEQPWFANNQMPDVLELDYLSQKLFEAIESLRNTRPVASKYYNQIYQTVNKQKKRILSRMLRKQHWYC